MHSAETVETYLRKTREYSFEFHDMVKRVRSLFLETCPGLREAVKYGGIVFLQEKELVGGIFVYKEHISVEFSQGASFHDSEGILEGKGRYRRHIKLHSLEEVGEKCVGDFIEMACK